MSLVVHNDNDAFVRVIVAAGPNKAFQFKTHPNIDKAAYRCTRALVSDVPYTPQSTHLQTADGEDRSHRIGIRLQK